MPVRRYPVVPAIALIIKILAVLTLLSFFYTYITQSVMTVITNWALIKGNPQYLGQAYTLVVEGLLKGLIYPALYWAAADLLLMWRDTEFNTRVAAGVTAEAPATAAPAAPAEESEGE